MDTSRITPYGWGFAAGLWAKDTMSADQMRDLTLDLAVQAFRQQAEDTQTRYLRRAIEHDRTLAQD